MTHDCKIGWYIVAVMELDAAQRKGPIGATLICVVVQLLLVLDIIRRLFDPTRCGLNRSCLLGKQRSTTLSLATQGSLMRHIHTCEAVLLYIYQIMWSFVWMVIAAMAELNLCLNELLRPAQPGIFYLFHVILHNTSITQCFLIQTRLVDECINISINILVSLKLVPSLPSESCLTLLSKACIRVKISVSMKPDNVGSLHMHSYESLTAHACNSWQFAFLRILQCPELMSRKSWTEIC